jgi:hypothetical protein
MADLPIISFNQPSDVVIAQQLDAAFTETGF